MWEVVKRLCTARRLAHPIHDDLMTLKRCVGTFGGPAVYQVSLRKKAGAETESVRVGASTGPGVIVLDDREWHAASRTVVDNPGRVFLPAVGPPPDGAASEASVMKSAEAYWRCVLNHKEASVAAALEAADAGDALLTAAGHYRRAVTALRIWWHGEFGTHLNRVFDPLLDKLLDRPLLRYIRHQVAFGARTRHEGPGVRLPAKPHPSAVGYAGEFLEKAWKDARAG